MSLLDYLGPRPSPRPRAWHTCVAFDAIIASQALYIQDVKTVTQTAGMEESVLMGTYNECLSKSSALEPGHKVSMAP